MTITYRINGQTVTRRQFAAHARRRVRLHGGLAEMSRARKAPAADTDEVHIRVNRSGMSESEKRHVAERARRLGLNEHVAYDPTIPKQQIYETRKQADAAVQAARDEADREQGRPMYRLHPQLVQELKAAKLKQDPSLAHRDQRELEEEIIETHSLPE